MNVPLGVPEEQSWCAVLELLAGRGWSLSICGGDHGLVEVRATRRDAVVTRYGRTIIEAALLVHDAISRGRG